MTTRLLVLPADPAADSTWRVIDASGRTVQHVPLAPGAKAPPHDARTGRTWTVVPASDVGLAWTALPARRPAQAMEAARLLLDDVAAAPTDRLHVAVSAYDGAAPRVLGWASPDAMQGWLSRAQAHGIDADAMVPDALLVPVDAADPERAVVMEHDGRWLVRSQDRAYSAEPALAARVLGDGDLPPPRDTNGFELACERVGAIDAPPLDLLQGGFAPRQRHRTDPGWRRAALLAGVLLASPWLLLAADAVRHGVVTRQLHDHASAIALRVAPGHAVGEPLEATAARLAELRSVDALARDAGALFGALDGLPGTHLASLRYSTGDGLRVQFVHPGETELETLTGSLAGSGLTLQRAGRQPMGEAVRSDILIEPGA
ncbi:type II secretion system protein GspL [Lysobacter sp. A3-1-A15]|uniref:type II secretion system protein GspL n=1 Tax=Novilysobacter viscosus TaxID=3098602 RepID=UPI002ED963A2